MTKLLENIFRSVNIALVNELSMLSDRMGVDIWEVVDAASTKPYGFMRFEPGPGMGGHCLPVDPFYLTWRAREFHMSTEFIELAGKINQQMPYYCVERIEHALNDATKPVKGSQILILGASYKGGVGDIRESPALRIMEVLGERGAVVTYNDPYVPELPDLGLRSVSLEATSPSADAVVLVTAHPGIDYAALAERARCSSTCAASPVGCGWTTWSGSSWSLRGTRSRYPATVKPCRYDVVGRATTLTGKQAGSPSVSSSR